jgi:hypothetical protein
MESSSTAIITGKAQQGSWVAVDHAERALQFCSIIQLLMLELYKSNNSKIIMHPILF